MLEGLFIVLLHPRMVLQINFLQKNQISLNPISPYANQKYYGELCCKMFSKVYGIETVSLRYFNVYGERQNLGGAYATVMEFLLRSINK